MSTTTIYQKRRAAVARALKAAGGGIALLPTAREYPRNRDSDFPYRHDSYFYYLTGFDEPEAWLAIEASGKNTLFCRPKDLEREIWDGIRLGPKAAPAQLGVDAAFSTEALDTQMPALLANQKSVWFPFATHEGLGAQVDGWLDKVRTRVRLGDEPPPSQHDLCGVLDEMRLFKDSHEIAILRRAGKISAGAHVRAMQTSAAMLRDPVKGGLREYHLEAELLHEFRRHGSQFPAYTSIVAAGANACVLHYRAGDAELKAGELCLIDAGCELDGYASDITRTFPADGKFTPAQRRLYDIVVESQYAAVKATKPGKRFQRPARGRAARAGPRHARHRPAAQGQTRQGRRRARVRRLSPVLHAPHQPLDGHGRARLRRLQRTRQQTPPRQGRHGPAHHAQALAHPAARHGADHRARPLCAARQERAQGVLEHRHPD
jgi:Xaa-Pro aminopeptidase